MKLLLIIPFVFLVGCSVSRNHAPGQRDLSTYTLGEDSYFRISATNLTRGEVTQYNPPTIIQDKKGRVVAAYPADPLAGILTAQNLNVTVGANQSKSFGKFMGAINNYILGWVTNTGTNATRDVNLAKEQTTRHAERQYTERYKAGIVPTVTDPEQIVNHTPFPPTR